MEKGIVYLVGAGPGDPGLITLRGKECLQQADFVLYDQLVSADILGLASPAAECVCVRSLAPNHPDRWPFIHARLIEEAGRGRRVVRLKGGDPLIFGRGGEEAEALRSAGIACEIVPGVTAALAAGAYLEIPLTHRSWSSAVALVTGHEHPDKPATRVDWKAIAAFPGTVVIYMGFSRLGAIVGELLAHGKAPDMPAAAVSHASCAEQQAVFSTLASLEADVRSSGLITPAVVIMGPVVGLRPEVSWFESRALLGQRVLITRPLGQAEDLAGALRNLGAIPTLMPALSIEPPLDWSPVDAAFESLECGGFDWLIFTSANGVHAFLQRLLGSGRDMRSLGKVRIATIGAATAASLGEYRLRADLMPGESMNSEGLLAQLREKAAGKRLLLAQAEQGRDFLRDELTQIAFVTPITVYRQVEALDRGSPVFDLLRRAEIDWVTLTSPNIARHFLNACDETIRGRLSRGEIGIICGNARTSAAVREFGLPVAAEAPEPTSAGLIIAVREMGGRNRKKISR